MPQFQRIETAHGSKEAFMNSSNIVAYVAGLTGLPLEYAQPYLEKIISEKGFNPKEIQLEDLREILSDFMQDVLLETYRQQNFDEGL
jgi:hypothetical protein